MEMRSKRSKIVLGVVGIAVIFLLGMGAERIIHRAEKSGIADTLFPTAWADNQPAGSDITTVVESSVPAVVNIQSKRVTRVRQSSPLFDDPFFRQFFGDRFNIPRERIERSLGSGVIVSPEGYILTNNHLVGGATEVTVILPDNRDFNARVVGTDERTDVAVLKIEAKGLPTIPIGKSSEVRLGQQVLAIGYPFGVGQTVTQGIISGLAKPIAEQSGVYVDFLQTDAAINPGNSGGALINTRGELVGINTLIVSNTGSYAGLGFAIPIDLAKQVMDDIVLHGRVIHGYLGVSMDNMTPDKAGFYGMKRSEGVIVTEVAQDSPAEKAGIKTDDVVVAVNGTPVKDMNDLRKTVGSLHPGDRAVIDIVRERKDMKVTVTIGARPDELEQPRAERPREEGAKPEFALLAGLGLEDLNDYYRRQLQIPSDIRGVIVVDVDPDSPATDGGLRRGDVIVRVNRKDVQNVREFNGRVKDLTGDKIMLTIYRGGALENVVLKQ